MTSSAWAGDKEGCKDPVWAKQRPFGYEISKCETKPWASIQVSLPQGRVRLEGQLEVVSYRLEDRSKDLASKAARDFYTAQAEKAGGKLVSPARDIYEGYVVQKSGKGDVYRLWDHGGG